MDILVVDDSSTICRNFSPIFGELGHQVVREAPLRAALFLLGQTTAFRCDYSSMSLFRWPDGLYDPKGVSRVGGKSRC